MADTLASEPDLKHDLKTLPMREVERQLATSTEGLSALEACQRLTRYGPDEIVEHTTNPLLKFLSY
ncbi:MAG: cation-transporting P-type ATPase, partial [Ornithinimicrobium sp.]